MLLYFPQRRTIRRKDLAEDIERQLPTDHKNYWKFSTSDNAILAFRLVHWTSVTSHYNLRLTLYGNECGKCRWV